MNSQEGINEKIERYLDQKMESRERADFEQMIKGNKEWEQKVLIIKEARLIILQESLFRFNEQIKIEEEKYLNKNKSFGKNYFLIGISILFIFLVLLFIKEEKKEQILIL